MFRMTLGTKLGIGFGLVLILTIAVAWFGWHGLSVLTDHFEKADDVNQLVKGIYQAQLAEKNYFITEQDNYLKSVNEQTEELVTQAQLTKEKFQQAVNKEQMDNVIKEVHEYENAFLNYVNLAKQKATALAIMQQEAEKVLHEAKDIHDNQEKQLHEIRNQAEAFLQEKINNADDATQLLHFAQDLKVLRLTLMQQESVDKYAKWQGIYQNIIDLTNTLKARFKQQENINHANTILVSYAQYQHIFQDFLTQRQQFQEQQRGDIDKMTTVVAQAMQEIQAIYSAQQAELNKELTETQLENVIKADEASRLLKLSLEAKVLHIALVQQEDTAKLAQWQKINQDIFDLARSLKTRFQRQADLNQVDTILTSYGQYQQFFLNFLQNRRDMVKQQQQQLQALANTAAEAMKQMQTIHLEQEEQLLERIKENTILIGDKLTNANDAGYIIQGIFETRTYEKQFIISGGVVKYAERVNQHIAKSLKLAQDLTSRLILEKYIKESKEVTAALKKYQNAFQHYVELTHQQNQANQIMITMAQQARSVNEMVRQDQQNKIVQEIHAVHRYLLISASISILLGIIIAVLITRSIVQPMVKTVALSQRLANGDLTARLEVRNTQDEVNLLLIAINNMAEQFQTIISETRHVLAQLAAGNLRVQIQGQFLGDFGEIKTALETTAANLDVATTQNNIQNWLKTGQSQLGEQTSGDKDIIKLAEDIINFLTPYLEAQVGAFYLLKENEGQEPYLKMIASHAYVWRKNAIYKFQLGEGIVGQAALERKMFVTAQAPDDYIFIQSGLGETPPRAILIAPFLYENALKGMIELAAFTSFTETHLEFLKQVLPLIAIAINTAESRTKMKVLLEQSQAQTEELRAQQEELQQSNEQLQSQSEELQSQAEELQSQQEELRQSNDMLQLRSQELERQQVAIQEKNTDLEQAKAVVQAKAEELELASKYKSEFLANMSHELRTPLNSMLILAQLLANNKEGNLTDNQAEYARTIYTSGNDLLTLINDILDLSKVEAGKLEISPEQFTFSELTTSLEQKFRPLAEKKGIDFTVNITEQLPTAVYTDKQRLQQIITNLLSNAFKFTSAGGVTLSIHRPSKTIDLSRSQLNPAQTIAFNVTDTGIGISKDKQKVIFEAFQQADGTTSRRYGGTGLGLSISRQLTQLLGGEIQLHSEAEQGSTFTVYLPEQLNIDNLPLPTESQSKQFTAPAATRAEPISQPIISSAPNQESSVKMTSASPSAEQLQDDRDELQPGDKSLLIIEDDLNFSHILMDIAKEKAFKCLLAADGYTGLKLVEQYRPSAIILDIGLPQLDGWTVMEKLKDKPETRHIPVHFVSGSDHSKDAKQLGAIGYSLKPVGMTELTDVFKQIDNFIAKTVKSLLIVTDDSQHQQHIVNLVQGEDIQLKIVSTRTEVQQQLQSGQFDCLILDVDIEHQRGIQLLEQQCHEPNSQHIPILTYAERDLTALEEAVLQKCAQILTVKEVHSPERLLDEVTLFLHQIESKLSQEQQRLLHKIRDPEAILSGRKVLLVDDDMRNIFALAASLEEKGMEIITAHNGQDALARLNEHPDTSMVLMDIMMPGVDGYEATRKIRAQQSFHKLPIIALTAKAMKGDKAKCIAAGANDYLAKPVNIDKLLSLLRVWLYP